MARIKILAKRFHLILIFLNAISSPSFSMGTDVKPKMESEEPFSILEGIMTDSNTMEDHKQHLKRTKINHR